MCHKHLSFLNILGVTVSFEQTASSVLEDSTLQLCAGLSLAAETLVAASVITAGGSAQLETDYVLTPSNQILTFEIGITRSCLTVQAVDDLVLENDEDFTLSLESNDAFVAISTTNGSSVITIPNQNSKSVQLCNMPL